MYNNLQVIGVTGGSGAGKGEVSHVFMSHGILGMDTDKVSREVCQPGKPCLDELVKCFGEEILNEDKTLNRRHLAKLVFAEEDEQKRHEKISNLNRITHHYIIEEINKWLSVREKAGDRFAVIDAPQLFESGFDKHCDYIVGVIANRDVRIRRIASRDGIDLTTAENRLRSQYPDEFFIENCDFIVHNDGGIDLLEGQVRNILRKLGYED